MSVTPYEHFAHTYKSPRRPRPAEIETSVRVGTVCSAPVTRTTRERRPVMGTGAVDSDMTLGFDEIDGALRRGAVVHLPEVLSHVYCQKVVDAAATVPFTAYEKTENSTDYQPILKYGPTMFDYIGVGDKTGYFDEGDAAAAAGTAAFANAGVVHPLTVALRALRTGWPGRVGVAREADGRRYFAGVMRDIASGALPHVDHARVETPESSIGRTVAQITLLFYVSVATGGGAVRIYDKTPTAVDYERHQVGYGFGPDAVRDVTFRGVTPGVGSVVMFPTTQIHSVDAVVGYGRRITWSTFVGLQEDGSLILWS